MKQTHAKIENITTKKTINDIYKKKIEELPLIVIAFEEGKDVAAVKRSVDRAVRNILEEYKKNKKF